MVVEEVEVDEVLEESLDLGGEEEAIFAIQNSARLPREATVHFFVSHFLFVVYCHIVYWHSYVYCYCCVTWFPRQPSALLLSLPGYQGAPAGDASALPFPNDAHPQSKLHEERVGVVFKAVL